jgi:hypothetical protein
MKKVILPLLSLFIVISCKNSKTSSDNTSLRAYSALLSKLDTIDITNTHLAVDKYKELFTNKPNSTCDSALCIFMEYYDRLNTALNNNLSNDTMKYVNNDFLDTLKISKYERKLNGNGFTFENSEGNAYIAEDWDFIIKYFSNYISPRMKKYIVKINQEDKQGFTEDGGLVISPTELADRIVWWEKFISSDTNFIYAQRIKESEKNNLSAFMLGLSNSPIINDSGKLDSTYESAYKYLLNKHPETKTSKIISPYYSALLKKNIHQQDSILNDYDKKKLIYKDYNN